MEAQHIVSGYSLWLYCKKCGGSKWDRKPADPITEVSTDGPNCYYEARKIARKQGWKINKQGFATCPKCK